VLDVDDGGNETLSALETIHGKLPDTVTVTGSGGRQHYIFKYPQGRCVPNKTKFAPGLDTRSNGGLIVVLLPHKREYNMSKICPVEYKRNNKAPRWIEFLNTITGFRKFLYIFFLCEIHEKRKS